MHRNRPKLLVLAALSGAIAWACAAGNPARPPAHAGSAAQTAPPPAQQSNAHPWMATKADIAALRRDVASTGANARKLARLLEAMSAAMGEGKYPSKEVALLGGLELGFRGANLAGKTIGQLDAQTLDLLFRFAATVELVSRSRRELHTVLVGSRNAIEVALQERQNPKVRWSARVVPGPHGPWALMQSMLEPFPATDVWPTRPAIYADGQQTTVRRYVGGVPTRDQLIVVDPSSHANVCPSPLLIGLAREVSGALELVQSREIDDPGLLEMGQRLEKMLEVEHERT